MKILYLDIESSPNLAHVWSLWNVNVSLNQLIEPTEMMSFAGKWADHKKVHYFDNRDRDRMLSELFFMLDEADVVVTWNGDSYDIPHINRELALADYPPYSPFKSFDLLKSVRRTFKFPSNKLQYVSTILGFAGKVKHEGHELWVACMKGDPKAWKRMEKYNKQDVILLQEIHDKLLPWLPGQPNRMLYDDTECTGCAEGVPVKRGFARLSTGMYQRFVCANCGTWFRGTKAIQTVGAR